VLRKALSNHGRLNRPPFDKRSIFKEFQIRVSIAYLFGYLDSKTSFTSTLNAVERGIVLTFVPQ
jgi:hypothetical protein